VLLATDVLKEEEIAIWMRFFIRHMSRTITGIGRPHCSEAEVPTFTHADQEYEAFSQTRLMPTAVLIAKITYVWLAQLTKQYGRQIRHSIRFPMRN